MYAAVPLFSSSLWLSLNLWITRRRKEAAKSLYVCVSFLHQNTSRLPCAKGTWSCMSCLPAFIFLPQPRSEHMTLWLLKEREKKNRTIPFSADKCGPCVSGRVKMRTMWTDDQGLSSGAELICTTLSFSMFHTCSWLLMPHCRREELTRLPRD